MHLDSNIILSKLSIKLVSSRKRHLDHFEKKKNRIELAENSVHSGKGPNLNEFGNLTVSFDIVSFFCPFMKYC